MSAIIHPYYILIAFLVSQSLMILKMIWKKESKNDRDSLPSRNIASLGSIFDIVLCLITYFTFYQLFFSKNVGIGNIIYYIVPMIISMALGTLYLIKTVFLNPSYFSLVFHSSIIIYELVIYMFFINSYSEFFYLAIPLFLFPISWIPIIKNKNKLNKLWDIRNQYYRAISPIFNIIMWLLCFIEINLQYIGYSIIVWF